MTEMDWHAPVLLLARFAADPASLEDATAASIEAHVVACSACQEHLAATADPAAIARSWDAVADRVDRPHQAAIERLLERLGLQSGIGRLLAATPALRVAGLLSVVVVAVGAAVAARAAGADGPFLVLAPLAPLAAVAVAFAPAADPAGEAAVATPMWGAGLVLRRAVAVLVSTFGVLAVASLGLPRVDAAALGWVLPGLALALVALALATWLRVETAVGVLATAWLLTVFATRWLAGRDAAFVDSATFTRTGQLVALLVAALAASLAVARRDRFATLEAFR